MAKDTLESPRAAWLNSRDEEGVGGDWGRGDCRPQGHSLRGGGVGFAACTRVCVQMGLEVEDKTKEGLRKSRNKARLVLINSAGHNPS